VAGISSRLASLFTEASESLRRGAPRAYSSKAVKHAKWHEFGLQQNHDVDSRSLRKGASPPSLTWGGSRREHRASYLYFCAQCPTLLLAFFWACPKSARGG
jgi:hypothetical protein